MITLRKFIVTERASLYQFEDYWNCMHNQNSEDYPLDLDHGQWLEQFQIFCEVHGEED